MKQQKCCWRSWRKMSYQEYEVEISESELAKTFFGINHVSPLKLIESIAQPRNVFSEDDSGNCCSCPSKDGKDDVLTVVFCKHGRRSGYRTICFRRCGHDGGGLAAPFVGGHDCGGDRNV